MNEQNNNQPMNNNMMNNQIPTQPMNNNMMNNQIPTQPINNNMMNNKMANQPIPPTKKNNKLIFVIGGSILAVSLVLIILFVFVFNSRTLVCTNSETSYGITMNMEATVKFKNNKAKSAKALITVDLGDKVEYMDMYLESLKESYSDYEEEGVTVDVTSDDKKIYVTIEGENTNSNFIGSSKETYEEVKKDLEEEGFTCK